MTARGRVLFSLSLLPTALTVTLAFLAATPVLSAESALERHHPPAVSETDPDNALHLHLLRLDRFAVKFDRPVRQVRPWDLTVNGRPARLLVGQGNGPYVFQDFDPPSSGPVEVLLSAGEIRSEEGRVPFEGRRWTFWLWDPAQDTDDDGLYNRTEIERGIDPLADDTDGDGIPDEVELAYPCLNAAIDETAKMRHLTGDERLSRDFDGDGISDLDEFRRGTDPCLAPERARALDKPVLEGS